jgi:MFS family permease
VQRLGPFRLLTLHYALYQLSVAIAGGFVGAYLLKLGFSMSTALLSFAALLGVRCALRFIGLGVVRRLGYRRALVIGAVVSACQFLPLTFAESPIWFAAWLINVSLAEALYWPVYHSAMAVTGTDASRGRELGIRAAVGALVGVIGPLTGGILLDRYGPSVDFGIAALLALASAAPLAAMANFSAGPVPSRQDWLAGVDRRAVVAFAADGWMMSGLALAWPLALFLSLGSEYTAFGIANAIAGVAGAAAGLVCGRAIDRGGRDRYLLISCLALAAGFALRAGAGWSPVAATIANATGAAVMALDVPVLMSVIYDRAKQSGAAYRFHFAAEAGWDAGAATGCLASAALAAWIDIPSLAVLPGALGILLLHRYVRTPRRSEPAAELSVGPVP